MPTYPLSFVPVEPNSEKLRLNLRQAVMESNFTLALQAVNSASQWMLDVTWPRMTLERAHRVQAWLNSLSGQVGTFTYSPRSRFASSLTGRTLAATGYPLSGSILVGGWAAGQDSALYLGQYLSVGGQLLQVTSAPANADGNGRCLIEIAPALRQQQAAGATVEFVAPRGLFRLASSETPAFTVDPDRLPEFPAVTFKEAIG